MQFSLVLFMTFAAVAYGAAIGPDVERRYQTQSWKKDVVIEKRSPEPYRTQSWKKDVVVEKRWKKDVVVEKRSPYQTQSWKKDVVDRDDVLEKRLPEPFQTQSWKRDLEGIDALA